MVNEFHNGSKNLTTGLPFLFGSMRIEELGIVYQTLTKTMRILAYQNTNLWQKYWTMDIFMVGWTTFKK